MSLVANRLSYDRMYFILPDMVHRFGLVEFQIFVIVSFSKKSKEIFKILYSIFYIRHIQIDDLTWTWIKDSFSYSNSSNAAIIKKLCKSKKTCQITEWSYGKTLCRSLVICKGFFCMTTLWFDEFFNAHSYLMR